MSAAPRPCSAPPRTSPLNGSSVHGTPGDTPTVSVCASNTIVGPGCAPSTTPMTLPTSSVHTLSNPSALISSPIRPETSPSSPLKLRTRTMSLAKPIRRSVSNIGVSFAYGLESVSPTVSGARDRNIAELPKFAQLPYFKARQSGPGRVDPGPNYSHALPTACLSDTLQPTAAASRQSSTASVLLPACKLPLQPPVKGASPFT